MTSADFYDAHARSTSPYSFSGCVIDGDHSGENPYNDALKFLSFASPHGAVILFHDFWGGGWIYQGAKMLQNHGWKVKVYWTPNGVACCWNTSLFRPPSHKPDPQIQPSVMPRMKADGFDLSIFQL